MNLAFWRRPTVERSLSVDEWLSYFNFAGHSYPFGLGFQTSLKTEREEIDDSFAGYVHQAYKANGVVFACMYARQRLASEVRFQYRQLRSGRPGDLFGDTSLELLEKPWPNGTTGDLTGRMLQDADLAGNAFVARRSATRLARLVPNWVDILIGSDSDPGVVNGDLDAEVVGYVYWPGGRRSGRDPEILLPEQVAHFTPIPDPDSSFRGMSWLTPVIRDVMGDKAFTEHKLKFVEAGATPNIIVKTQMTNEQLQAFVQTFRVLYEGGQVNPYQTMFLGQGADPTVVGADFKQLDFKIVQGHGETRIASAAGVPPIIVGLSEGLQAATYSNYGQARRAFADLTMRPLWRGMAAALANLIDVPDGGELWYDDRDIMFLQDDVKDAADVQKVQADAIKQLTEAGYEWQSVVDAVVSGDLKRLKHSGLLSVQLQEPGTQNGNGGPPVPADTQPV